MGDLTTELEDYVADLRDATGEDDTGTAMAVDLPNVRVNDETDLNTAYEISIDVD